MPLVRLRSALATRAPGGIVLEPFPISRPAAVLVPLYEAARDVHVVLTRRPWTMRTHGGEVSFPGGGRDPADADLVQTALREAREEIGLPPEHVEVIGRLDPLATLSSGAHITPFVGVVSDLPELTPSPREVEAVLHVPLHELLAPGVYHQERWPPIAGMAPTVPPTAHAPSVHAPSVHAPSVHASSAVPSTTGSVSSGPIGTGPPSAGATRAGLRPMHFFDLAGDTIWGATARMLFQLLTIATGTDDPERLEPSRAAIARTEEAAVRPAGDAAEARGT